MKINSQNVPHKRLVKYLGIHLDDRLHFNKYLEIQLQKARAAFMFQKRLFYCQHLNQKSKFNATVY